jgi:nicotinamidase-related amidase
MPTALLIIDVQKALFEKGTPVYQADDLLSRLCILAERAHVAGSPVYYIQHCNESFLLEGTEGWQLHPRLQPLTGDIILHKQHGNAFEKTGLHAQLQARGVDRVVIGGLVTHGCVRASCEGAQALGYQVTLVSDGHSSFHRQAARLIGEWNQRLSGGGVDVRPECKIDFK